MLVLKLNFFNDDYRWRRPLMMNTYFSSVGDAAARCKTILLMISSFRLMNFSQKTLIYFIIRIHCLINRVVVALKKWRFTEKCVFWIFHAFPCNHFACFIWEIQDGVLDVSFVDQFLLARRPYIHNMKYFLLSFHEFFYALLHKKIILNRSSIWM